MRQPTIPLGIGVYSRADAARLLRMTPPRVSRWVVGYTYWLRSRINHQERRSERPPVVHTDLPQVDNVLALSFLELMELRVIKALVDKGFPLQRVRKAAAIASRDLNTMHPFAARRVFVDERFIFVALEDQEGTPNLLQLDERRHHQINIGEVLRPFLEEIEFDNQTSLAKRWWPLGRQIPVVLNPRVAFGAPTIDGTGTRTDVVAQMAAIASRRTVSEAYQLERRQVQAAVRFEKLLAAA